MAKTERSEKVILKDFRDSVYYDTYSKVLDEYSIKLIKESMLERWTDDDKRFNWNDVLKEVFKFINTDLKEFKDSIDVNPNRDEIAKQKLEKMLKIQAKQMLGINWYD
jgi:hypothetical protein